MVQLPIPSMHGVTTERLRFRTLAPEDHAWWMAYINDARSIRFMPFTLGSEADCAAFIQRSLDRVARDGSGLHAVLDKASGGPLGCVGLLTQQVDNVLELEIGYHLLPSATGKGYATEAAMACKAFARTHDLSRSVISLIHPDNHASQAVAKRNGMAHEKDTVHHGKPALVFRTTL